MLFIKIFEYSNFKEMELTEKILIYKNINKISWDDIAKNLPVTGNELSMSFRRHTVDKNYLLEITNSYPEILNYNDSKEVNTTNIKQPVNQLNINEVINFVYDNEALLKQDNKWRTYIENIELRAVNAYITKNLK